MNGGLHYLPLFAAHTGEVHLVVRRMVKDDGSGVGVRRVDVSGVERW